MTAYLIGHCFDAGLTERRPPRVLGVDPKTVRNDLGKNSPEGGEKVPTTKAESLAAKNDALKAEVVQFPVKRYGTSTPPEAN